MRRGDLASACTLLALTLVGCAGSDRPKSQQGMLDVRVTPPPGDASTMDFYTPELTIGPGEERQWCSYMLSPPEDVFVQVVDQLQGQYGHHAVLLTAKTAHPEGTVIDCTDPASMADLNLTLLPLELPPGYAQRLPGGQTMVLQSHYVNTSTDTLLVRDVVRLHTVPQSSVTTPAAPFATHDFNIDIPPHGTPTLTFDCPLAADTKIITVGGHMHEWGASFKLEHGTGGQFAPFYQVPQWIPSYRDSPPIDHVVSSPVSFAAGDVIRTTCVWNNTSDRQLVWPHEMCASFGLIEGTFTPLECNVGQ